LRWAVARRVLLAVVALLFLYSLLVIVVTGPAVVAPPFVELDLGVSSDRLRADVEKLCRDFGTRHVSDPESLDRAARWIGAEMGAAGLSVEEQSYTLSEGTFRNVIATREGTRPGAGSVVIGAHYDAYGRFPGADDNASGVAVLLELVRTLDPAPPRRTQYFVAFSTEEPPFFGTDEMGSAVYARSLVERDEDVRMMVALDGVGYFTDVPGSQRLPLAVLQWVYPDRGDFIGVVGDLGAGRWIKQAKAAMMATSPVPVRSFRGPGGMAGVLWSDHLPFRERDLPGILVTDTLFMRGMDYHGESDLPETLDYERMAGVVLALHGLLRD
jgi:hypothetical protein